VRNQPAPGGKAPHREAPALQPQVPDRAERALTMSQYILRNARPYKTVFAVLVDEKTSGRYTIAQMNGILGIDARTESERLAAMKRLYLKMKAAYPGGDVELVKIVPIDADRIAGGIEDPAQMSRDALILEIKRLRAKGE
jgi:hypothetical protein